MACSGAEKHSSSLAEPQPSVVRSAASEAAAEDSGGLSGQNRLRHLEVHLPATLQHAGVRPEFHAEARLVAVGEHRHVLRFEQHKRDEGTAGHRGAV